jgi:hypothetical protein
MNSLSGWDVSSKGLIYSRLFDNSVHTLEEQKKALTNILKTQGFDLMPLVMEAAKKVNGVTTQGAITGVAILSPSKDTVEIIDIDKCPCVPKSSGLILSIIKLLQNPEMFVFIGPSASEAEALITPTMLNNDDVRDSFVLSCADAFEKGKIESKSSGYGIDLFKRLKKSIEHRLVDDSLIGELKTIESSAVYSTHVDEDSWLVPRGEVTAQHIMKFPVAGVTKGIDRITNLASNMLRDGNDFTNILLYDKGGKLPDDYVFLQGPGSEGYKKIRCRMVQCKTDLKTIINRIDPTTHVCIVAPDPDIIVRGNERMLWPAIIEVSTELQSLTALKEIGRLCVEIEVAKKFQDGVSKSDNKTTLGSLAPHHKRRDKYGNKKKGAAKRNSKIVDATFIGEDSMKTARDQLFHAVLGGDGKLTLTQLKNVVRVHDSLKSIIAHSKRKLN